MSEQALDLRRSAQIVRRHKILVSVVAGLGLAAGAGYAVLNPPMLTSQALVVLPQTSQSAAQSAAAAANGVADPYAATQEIIADSNRVLADALPDIRPAMSLDELRGDVQAGSLTPYVISVSAKGKVAADAEAIANAVAHSYIRYIGSADSPVGQMSAQLLEPATSAAGPAPLKRFGLDALAGALAGALIGAIAALAIGRNDRRLRERDEIADSIGLPVLASVSVHHPSDAAGWTKLLEGYEPGAVDAWRLRKALHQLGLAGTNSSSDLRAGSGSSLVVLSLSTDRKALALGPQLAVFAASLGIPTALVVGPQQDANTTATLHAACSAPMQSIRSRNLQVAVGDRGIAGQLPGAVLTVIVAVVDGQTPRIADTVRATVTVLGVSAGAATAEQLARVATSAAAEGRDLAGILVADPDAADQTTGRVPQLARPGQRRMPARMIGTTTETR